jgi:hypothetical protein
MVSRMAAIATEEPTRQLTAIELAGFKSAIDPVRVNFRDITILAGANSTGKSTIMQPLLLIKQTIEKPFDPGGLAIDGPLVRFSQAGQFLSYGASKGTRQTFSIKFLLQTEWIKFVYGRSNAAGIDLLEMSFTNFDREFHWKNGQSLKNDDASIIEPDIRGRLWTRFSADFPPGWEVRVVRDRAVLAAGIGARDDGPSNRVQPLVSPGSVVADAIRDLIYLPGLRGNPERHYVISAGGPEYPGSFNDYVASIVHLWGSTADSRLKRLEDDLKQLGLTWRVTTQAVDDTRVEIRVGRLPAAARGGARDTVNIADVGFGVSQTLPVLVAFQAANRNQIVFVEQPELHLHPRAQVALANVLLQAANRGARLVIETHSSLLILALQAAIAEGRIAPDRVSLNWFTRDATGQTHVTEAQVGEDGSYGDWPEDFGAVELDLQDRYMTLVEQRHARG